MSAEVTSIKVYTRHLRMAKICSSGARDWWKHNGLSWPRFLADGIAAETLLETGDPFAKKVVEIARNEHVE